MVSEVTWRLFLAFLRLILRIPLRGFEIGFLEIIRSFRSVKVEALVGRGGQRVHRRRTGFGSSQENILLNEELNNE